MSQENTFQGVWTALITPFQSSGSVDEDQFRSLIRNQIKSGVQGIVPCGTTGESPTLSTEEKKRVISIALEETKGSPVGVLAGTGSNNTQASIEFSKWASDQGVKGVLIVTPYYNKPTPRGLELHFSAIADSVDCEVVLYNVPGRTITPISLETIVKLSKHPKITTIKEASGDSSFTKQILNECEKENSSIDVLSGDDPTYWPTLQAGAIGTISVASNLVPEVMVELTEASEENEIKKGDSLHEEYLPVFKKLFIESNPIPIKYAMHLKFGFNSNLRLPLCEMTDSHQNELKSLLNSKNLLIERNS